MHTDAFGSIINLILCEHFFPGFIVQQGGGAAGGRWGGEEFMILLTGLDKAAAGAFAEKLRAEIERLRFPKCGSETASFGVAQVMPGESADHLTSRADAALYAAKNAGKNRVCTAEE